jgi:hypothetical protein
VEQTSAHLSLRSVEIGPTITGRSIDSPAVDDSAPAGASGHPLSEQTIEIFSHSRPYRPGAGRRGPTLQAGMHHHDALAPCDEERGQPVSNAGLVGED